MSKETLKELWKVLDAAKKENDKTRREAEERKRRELLEVLRCECGAIVSRCLLAAAEGSVVMKMDTSEEIHANVDDLKRLLADEYGMDGCVVKTDVEEGYDDRYDETEYNYVLTVDFSPPEPENNGEDQGENQKTPKPKTTGDVPRVPGKRKKQ